MGGTLCILQNQWGRTITPQKQAILDSYVPRQYSSVVAWGLQGGCLTGRRLQKAFGEDYSALKWTNASRKVSPVASGRYDYDLEHLTSTLDHFKPFAVLCFGKVALDGFMAWQAAQAPEFEGVPFLIPAPHPAARMPDIQARLVDAVSEWREIVGPMGAHGR